MGDTCCSTFFSQLFIVSGFITKLGQKSQIIVYCIVPSEIPFIVKLIPSFPCFVMQEFIRHSSDSTLPLITSKLSVSCNTIVKRDKTVTYTMYAYFMTFYFAKTIITTAMLPTIVKLTSIIISDNDPSVESLVASESCPSPSLN